MLAVVSVEGGSLVLDLAMGKPLPRGWVGKLWACHQLSEAANGGDLNGDGDTLDRVAHIVDVP